MGQPINDTAAPPLRSLSGEDVFPDRPVEQNQLAIHGEGSPNLCGTDASPEVLEQFRVAGGNRVAASSIHLSEMPVLHPSE
jgi:hypothetical protein